MHVGVQWYSNTVISGTKFCTLKYYFPIGDTLTLSRVSPEAIILRLSEKLVIEVEATGRYEAIFWTRNGNQFSPTLGNPFFVRFPFIFPTSSELANSFEILFREPTTESDFGVYEVQLDIFNPNSQSLHPSGGQVDFAVIQAGEKNALIILVLLDNQLFRSMLVF